MNDCPHAVVVNIGAHGGEPAWQCLDCERTFAEPPKQKQKLRKQKAEMEMEEEAPDYLTAD